MVDFVGILKKTINAQSNITPQVRERIYKRAIETLEYQFVEAAIPPTIANEQRQILRDAITNVETEYREGEKKLFSSAVGWQFTDVFEVNDKNTKNAALSRDDSVSVLVTEKKQEFSVTNLKDSATSNELSALGVPDAEPVNMNFHHLASQHVGSDILKDSTSAAIAQIDNFHIVSHIFSQALRRANRPSMQKRIAMGAAILISFMILIIGIYLICKYILVLNGGQLSKEKSQVSSVLSRPFSVNQKLTQRLLEDGSEVDVGLEKMASSSNGEGKATAVTTNFQSIKQLGEAVLYQERTSYDAEKVATGSVRWSLVKESNINGALEESIIRGDITIPDKGLSLQLTLRRNTDRSFPAAYIIDLIFTLSDKFSGHAISNIKELTFKLSEQSIGQALKNTVVAKINDNFFLIALSGNNPFLNQNLQLMQELNWIHVVLTDENGRTNELTFTKGSTGETIFNEVLEQWLAQQDKLTVIDEKKE
ncbi:hypothetical protein V3565_02450 [Bartonella sp. B10]